MSLSLHEDMLTLPQLKLLLWEAKTDFNILIDPVNGYWFPYLVEMDKEMRAIHEPRLTSQILTGSKAKAFLYGKIQEMESA